MRCALAYAAPIGVNGIMLPYFPVWLNSLHFSEFEIGIVLAIPLIVRIIAAPVVGAIADRLQERSRVLFWSGGLSLLTAVALYSATEFWPVLLIYCLQAAVFAAYVPVVDSIAVSGVRRWGFEYGSLRVWGSVGFVVMSLLMGQLIGLWGGRVLPAVAIIAFATTLLAAYVAPRLGPARRNTSLGGVGRFKGLGAWGRIDLHLIMIGASIAQASHAMFYAFGAIHWQDEGFGGTQIGILWSTAVIAEILVFFASGIIARRLSPWTLMRFGCAVAVLRWVLFPIPLGFWGYFLLQSMHAFTFTFLHIGVQHKLVEMVQEDQESSMQGAYFFYNGAFLALATFGSGILYRQYGAASFAVMALAAVAGLLTIALAARLQPQRSGGGGNTVDPS
ncbi:MFS transporter [Rhizobium halophilum]|uniref:MFS transporter n=1 Tax=Rhizobium halophilum TaxID=2846852 RepID=UPI001EFE346C|nr:MFS transporter [Rhizobium halophilum]MCF6368431.1 MFS transporter [Rhizobium halophilum]